MPELILVGVDDGRGGRDALALAAALRPPGTRIVLARIWDLAEGVLSAATGTAEHPATTAGRLVERLRRTVDPPCGVAIHGSSSVGAGLHRLAEDLGADLLVIGSPGPSGGSTAIAPHLREALHAAPCALALAPPGFAEHARPISRVGVAFQPSPAGEAALVQARILAERTGATLHGLQVVPLLPAPWLTAPAATLTVLEDLIGTSLREATADLRARGLVPHVVTGLPATEIARFSEQVDILVLGSRGYGPVRRLLFGSTTAAVAGVARCPMLVVRSTRAGQIPAGQSAEDYAADPVTGADVRASAAVQD